MCGIVGAVATRNIVPILVQGLQRLEYRGYDSCGIAVNTAGVAPPPVRLRRVRGISRVADLAAQAAEQGVEGHIGIAHTRWATHGAPAVSNAHPHFSMGAHGGELAGDAADDARGRVTLVHNGIIENHETLRRELEARGYHFSSQTDTEVIVHLIDSLYDGDLFEAVQAAARQLHGSFAIAVLHRDEPQRLVGARQGSPLVLGVGADGKEHFLASDAMALAGVTDQIAYLEDGDVVDVQLGKHWIVGAGGQRVQRAVKTVQVASGAAELGPYRHYMQKEIFEQPRAVADTLEGVLSVAPELFEAAGNHAPGEGAHATFGAVDQVLILACGTSYYAGCVAKYWLEAVARIPTQVEIASEYRYRASVANPRTLVVTISQSGETADTLAALRHAQELGMRHTLTVCNVPTSAMVRECRLAYLTRAGAEIGVASTKAFTTQLVGLFLLRGALSYVGTVAAHAGTGAGARAAARGGRGQLHQPAAPPAGSAAGRAGAGAAGDRLGRAVRQQGKRPVPGPRAALPDRPGGRAQAQGDHLHPRRGVCSRRTQARPAGAGDQQHAGGHRGAP